MAKTDVWMPIYIGDYLRDTEELSSSEHGAYLLLLMHYWQKKGVIGCDVDRLARVARSDSITCGFVLGYFFTLVDGNYKNKRADKEMENAEGRRRSSRENGQKGGRPSINNPEITYGLSVGIPIDNLAHNLRKSSSSSSSEEYNITKDTKHKYGKEKNVLLTDEQYQKLISDLGERMALDCIEELSGYRAMKGYKCKRDDLAIKKWVVDAVNRKQPPTHSQASSAVIDKPVPKRKCESCGSTDLAPSWCRVCKWDFIQEPHQWFIDHPIEPKT